MHQKFSKGFSVPSVIKSLSSETRKIDMVYDIKGKVALVTGGAVGIGFNCSMELLKNGIKGLVIADMDSTNGEEAVVKITKEFGAKKVVFITTDVTQKDQLEAAFKMAISTFGTIDIVINNAGILSDADWEMEIAINCNAVVQGTLLGIKYMGTNNGGKGGIIVNIASVFGLQEITWCPIYAATKHFVVGMTKSFGTPYFYNKTGIKYLTLCPGVTDTALTSDIENVTLDGFSDLGKLLADEIKAIGTQPVMNVAKGMLSLITNGENGSIYVAEANEPAYEIHIPDRKTFKKH